MKNQINKINAFCVVVIALALGLARSGGNQATEANRAVETANKKLDEAKELFAKTEARNTDLFSANIQTVQQLRAYKTSKSSEAKAIVADYEKVTAMIKEVSKHYDDILRMNVNEKYKDYAKLKSEEYAKRAEAIGIRKGNAQAFTEIDDPQSLIARLDENIGKSDRLFKDAKEMGGRAKKMEEENKNIFKDV